MSSVSVRGGGSHSSPECFVQRPCIGIFYKPQYTIALVGNVSKD